MTNRLERFEAIARRISKVPHPEVTEEPTLHAFDQRNIHVGLPAKVRKLFDDGHYAEATFEAFKYLDKTVQKHAGISESGFKLMMAAFDESKPLVKLTPLGSTSELDEQKGFRFVFAGGVLAIRNPRGHEYSVPDDPDQCLDHLAFASLLLRRLEQSGFV
jgi:uncharacterized protein (TIGR02391 family)